MPAWEQVGDLRRLLHHLRQLLNKNKIAVEPDLQQLRHLQQLLRHLGQEDREAAGGRREGGRALVLRNLSGLPLMI